MTWRGGRGAKRRLRLAFWWWALSLSNLHGEDFEHERRVRLGLLSRAEDLLDSVEALLSPQVAQPVEARPLVLIAKALNVQNER